MIHSSSSMFQRTIIKKISQKDYSGFPLAVKDFLNRYPTAAHFDLKKHLLEEADSETWSFILGNQVRSSGAIIPQLYQSENYEEILLKNRIDLIDTYNLYKLSSAAFQL